MAHIWSICDTHFLPSHRWVEAKSQQFSGTNGCLFLWCESGSSPHSPSLNCREYIASKLLGVPIGEPFNKFELKDSNFPSGWWDLVRSSGRDFLEKIKLLEYIQFLQILRYALYNWEASN